MKVSELISDFLEHCEIEKGHSQMTVQNYDHYLQRFLNLAGKNLTPKKITPDVIRNYRLHLNRLNDPKGQFLKKKTQNYHLIALRSFLKYLARRKIDSLDASEIELAKEEERQIAFLEPAELEQLFSATNQEKNDLIRLRDRAILEVLFSTGLRVSELANLHRERINLERGEFSVQGKGGKTRVVFLSDAAKEHLNNYLSKRPDNAPPVFVRDLIHKAAVKNIEGELEFCYLSPRTVQRILVKYSKLAGITKKVTPHVLRHSYATDLLRSGADLRNVQALLGHTSVTTTQIYTHITDKSMKETHQKFHRQIKKPLRVKNESSAD